MMLLTKANRAALPPLHSTENEEDPTVQVKFFDPTGSWSWYATEFDGADTFFGWVDGMCPELGYFSLRELSDHRGRLGLGIERDLHFSPRPLGEVMVGD
jgi:hypothetical protein